MERLGEISSTISAVFRVVESLRERKNMLMRITDDAKRLTHEVHSIKLPDDPLLQELKAELHRTNYCINDLQRFAYHHDTIYEFRRFVLRTTHQDNIESGEFYKKLKDVQETLINFSHAVKGFRDRLRQSKQLAELLSDSLEQRAQEAERQAESTRARTVAGTTGLLAGGAGVVAISVLTGGVALIATGALAGTTCSVGAAVTAGSDLNEMRDLAEGFRNHSNQLDAIARNLESICCKVETSINTSEDVEVLRNALYFFKQEEMARKLQAENDAKEKMAAKMLSCCTVDTMTPPREQKIELIRRVIQDTKMRANELEAFNLSNEPLMEELKPELRMLQESGSILESRLENFRKEIKKYETTVKEKIKGMCVLQLVLKEFYGRVSNLSEAFESFLRHLRQSQFLATELMGKVEQKAAKMEKPAYELSWSGTKVRSAAAEEVLLGTLRFLTGGAARNVLDARTGAVCSAEESVMVSNTSIDVQAMQDLATGIKYNSNKLGFIIAMSSCNVSGTINLDKAAVKHLQSALEFFSENLFKDDGIGVKDAMVEAKIDAKDAELARLKDRMKMHNFY